MFLLIPIIVSQLTNYAYVVSSILLLKTSCRNVILYWSTNQLRNILTSHQSGKDIHEAYLNVKRFIKPFRVIKIATYCLGLTQSPMPDWSYDCKLPLFTAYLCRVCRHISKPIVLWVKIFRQLARQVDRTFLRERKFLKSV